MRILITYFLLLQSFIGLSQSSFYNEIGKNGIQYKNFKWKVIYSNNFELYFNDGSENIANIALDHIEENFSKLSSNCLLYTAPSPRDRTRCRMACSA